MVTSQLRSMRASIYWRHFMNDKAKKPLSGMKEASSITAINSNSSTSTVSQHNKIVAVLRRQPTTTLQLREQHGICSPASRIMELKRQGFEIHKDLVTAIDSCGVEHRNIARYALLQEVSNG